MIFDRQCDSDNDERQRADDNVDNENDHDHDRVDVGVDVDFDVDDRTPPRKNKTDNEKKNYSLWTITQSTNEPTYRLASRPTSR